MPVLEIGHRTSRRLRYCVLMRKTLIFELSICFIL
jgi:hypothetical protein